MKFKTLYTLAFSSLILFSCGEAPTEQAAENTEEEATMEATTYTADATSSTINWRGEVAGVYGHEGYVNLQSGSLTLNGDVLAGGEFVVDMSVIYPTDSASYKDQDGGRITDLQGHLSTEDFFGTEAYPSANFVISSVNGNTVTGNLTVKGKTNEETFEISSLDKSADGVTVSGAMTFDRQKYNVSWVHFMEDMILSDDIALTISITATK